MTPRFNYSPTGYCWVQYAREQFFDNTGKAQYRRRSQYERMLGGGGVVGRVILLRDTHTSMGKYFH